MICYIVNTAEYCHQTVSCLATTHSKVLVNGVLYIRCPIVRMRNLFEVGDLWGEMLSERRNFD